MSDVDAAALAYGSNPEKNAHLWPMIEAVILEEIAESQRLWAERNREREAGERATH